MDSREKEFQDVLKHIRDVDARIAADPTFEGAKPEPPIKPLFVESEDEFGGNENNRRVAQRELKTKEVVEGKATSDDLVNLHKKQAAQVRTETEAALNEEKYPTSTPTGQVAWRPNS